MMKSKHVTITKDKECDWRSLYYGLCFGTYHKHAYVVAMLLWFSTKRRNPTQCH